MMWRTEQDVGASTMSTPGPKSLGPHGRGSSEAQGRPASISVSQHPSANPTPFSAFPTAWAIGTSPVEYANPHARLNSNSMHPPNSIVYAPSDLLPHGLLASPQPSTPATTLLKLVGNRSISVVGPDATYPNANGDSPAASGGPATPPLDSLVLPSPSLLPGGVHSLPTPTSSSQHQRHHDGYGYGAPSPVGNGSNRDFPSSPRGEHSNGSRGPHAPRSSSSKRLDGQMSQASRGSSGGGAASQGHHAEGTALPRGSGLTGSGGQTGMSNSQQAAAGSNNSGGYNTSGVQHSHGFHAAHHHHASHHQSAAAGAGMPQQPGSPSVGYASNPYYVAQLPPGAVMMTMHHPGDGSANSSRGSGSGVMIPTAREGSAGSGWRGNRSGGGAVNGSSNSGKHHHQYGHQQQMQGPMAHDGTVPYGMAHMHPGPYAVYGMMAPGIVVPQVAVVGSPRGMETHGHHHSHMGTMVVSHGPSMAMGLGMGMAPMHGYSTHGHMTATHMGMPTMAAHHTHMGGPHGFSHPSAHNMAGGFQYGHYGGPTGGTGYGQQQYGHTHAGGSYGTGRGGAGKASGGAGAGLQQQQGYAAAGQKNQLPPRAPAESGAGGGAASGNNSLGRNSPATARGRAGARDKQERSRASEQRERKSGNSRAPATVAQCAAEVAGLDEELRNLVRKLMPGAEELAAHQTAFDAVRQLVDARWPHVKVHLFGSAANGLSLAGANEIDVTIEVPDMVWDDHAAKAAMVSEIGELATGGGGTETTAGTAVSEPNPEEAARASTEVATLLAPVADEVSKPSPSAQAVDGDAAAAAAEHVATASTTATEEEEAAATGDLCGTEGTTCSAVMTAVSALPKARTPVVKLTVAETQTRVDITISNMLGISNTRMLGHYCEVDPRLRQLVLLVKHWAKIRSVNDAYRGSLSSYAYVLLCIWLLQQRQPPILPVLQARQPHTYDTIVGPWRCAYNDEVKDLQEFGVDNKESLAELLVAFFDHWAWRHDYNGSVVCVRTGGTMAKSAKEWTKRQGNERHLMCIEDPFELSHDLGRTIDKAAVQVLRREFERAARIFASSPDPLTELLAPLTPEEEAVITAALQSRRKSSKDKDKEREKDKQTAAAAGSGDAESGAAKQSPEVAGPGEGGSSSEVLLNSRGSGSEEQDSEEDEELSGGGQASGEGWLGEREQSHGKEEVDATLEGTVVVVAEAAAPPVESA